MPVAQEVKPRLRAFLPCCYRDGRGVNAAIEAEPVVEQSCFVSIKELPVPSNVPPEGDREVMVTK